LIMNEYQNWLKGSPGNSIPDRLFFLVLRLSERRLRIRISTCLLSCPPRDQISPRVAVDLIVRDPEDVQRRLEANDFFLREVVEKGKILYESTDD
jgi:hypothetical protein